MVHLVYSYGCACFHSSTSFTARLCVHSVEMIGAVTEQQLQSKSVTKKEVTVTTVFFVHLFSTISSFSNELDTVWS
jgi:hypothetical protein